MGNQQSGTHDSEPEHEDLRASFILCQPKSQKHTKKRNDFSEEAITRTLRQCKIHLDHFDPNNPTGPVLVIKSATEKDQVQRFVWESEVQPQNQLMVVLTTKLYKNCDGHPRLVQLKWEKDGKNFLKNQNLSKVQEFIRKCPPKAYQRVEEQRQGIQYDSFNASDVPSTSRDAAVSDAAQFQQLSHGTLPQRDEGVFVRPDALPPHRTNIQRSAQGASSGATNQQLETQQTSSTPFIQPDRVDYAFDRDNKDSLLMKALQFVQTSGGIELVKSKDVTKSLPLLVFCLNDTRLQEDIENAERKTRSGKDVMLLVVTDRKDLRLIDTKATKVFGNKARLCWDHEKKKFRESDNKQDLVWIQKFLDKYGKEFTIQFSRFGSLKRTASQRLQGKASGVYRVLPSRVPVSESLLQNVVYFFNKKFVELNEDRQGSGAFVLFCFAAEGFERDVSAFIRPQGDAEIIVVALCRKYKPSVVRIEGREISLLFIKELDTDVEDRNENKMAVNRLKRFLNEHSKSESGPKEGNQEMSVNDQPARGFEDTLSASSAGSRDSATSPYGVQVTSRQTCPSSPMQDIDLSDRFDRNGRGHTYPHQTSEGYATDAKLHGYESQDSRYLAHDHTGQLDPSHEYFSRIGVRQETVMEAEDFNTDSAPKSEQKTLGIGAYHRDTLSEQFEHKTHRNPTRTNQRRGETPTSLQETHTEGGSFNAKRYDSKHTGYVPDAHSSYSQVTQATGCSVSDAYSEGNPHKPQSQRRRQRKPRDTILPEGDGATVQKPGSKRAAEEPLEDLITSIGAMSVCEKERKQELEPLRPKSRARRQKR
ncbi:uncharacterized protein [Littorina saxatilis]|uniref:Uncharacterized protein n=1 Tax=Littorina saxatilis TaxID=31220 RepID=A0AAN9B5A6_9CAEN